jgi:hypothetical protein
MQVDYGYSSRSRLAEDRLSRIFEMREKFMQDIREKRGAYGEWPVDMGDKKSQQLMREIALKGVEEMFEALGELKNWKSHRVTENRAVNREAFLEEIVDAFNYFFALLILAGVNADELFAAYEKKDAVIHDRLNNGY